MLIRGLVFIISMVLLFTLAFYEGRVDDSITQIFKWITTACTVFFFGDVLSGVKNIRIGRKQDPE